MRGVLSTLLNNSPLKLAGLGMLALSACSKSNNKSPTLESLNASQVTPGQNVDRQFETDEGQLRVVDRASFEAMIARQEVRPLAAPRAPSEDSLIIGFPKSALGKEHVFGAVITATDDKENEEYGGLKLTDMTPFHVYPRQETDTAANTSILLLEGCVEECKPGFPQREAIMGLPIQGESADQLFIDFSVVGSDLNLVQIMDPEGEFLHLKAVSAETVKVAFSDDTLLFDVLGKMEEMAPTPEIVNLLVPAHLRAAAPAGKEVNFTTRWYLKKRLVNTKFKPQIAANGVGYFMTERFQTPHVIKHANVDSAGQPIVTHYFVKNVPAEHQESFKQAFEDWNDQFERALGARILKYELIDDSDPLAAAVVAGDVRIKVLEWDLNNKAGYGGLGPSIADQETGAIITSNTLVQGPEIVKIYTEWFQANQEARVLRDMGEEARADEVLKETRNALFQEIQAQNKKPTLALALNGKFKFNINAQDPRMQDEVAASKLDFEIVPEGMTYEQYMSGYFRDLVAHELGHNMGLRHNFRGNLFAEDSLEEGKVSASIMEYLSRQFRYKSHLGAYDVMAIDHGYALKAPTRTDMFCTDENVGNIARHSGSAECSRDDGENNPYRHLSDRLTRVRDLFIGKGTAEAPAWTKEDALPHFTKYSDGVLLYGESAQRSMSTWIRFFEAPGRPAKNVAEIQKYVTKTLADIACEAGLEDELKAAKGEGDAAKVSLENLAEFRKMTQDRVREVLGAELAAQISCANAAPAEVAAQ